MFYRALSPFGAEALLTQKATLDTPPSRVRVPPSCLWATGSSYDNEFIAFPVQESGSACAYLLASFVDNEDFEESGDGRQSSPWKSVIQRASGGGGSGIGGGGNDRSRAGRATAHSHTHSQNDLLNCQLMTSSLPGM